MHNDLAVHQLSVVRHTASTSYYYDKSIVTCQVIFFNPIFRSSIARMLSTVKWINKYISFLYIIFYLIGITVICLLDLFTNGIVLILICCGFPIK